MTAPAPAPSRNLPANEERAERSDAFLSPRVLAREAAKIVADLGITLSPARIRLLVTAFVRDGRTDLDFRAWVVAYADPTGETAVRNVMREQTG